MIYMATIKDDTTGRIINAQAKDYPMHLTRREPNNFLLFQEDMRIIFEKMMGDQELLKLLYYSSPDAVNKPDIEDNEILEYIAENNIRLVPDLTIPEKQISIVSVYMDDFSVNSTNPQYIDNFLTFEILCPVECWKMDNYQFRPMRIMHRIQSLFNNSKLNGIGRVEYVLSKMMTIGTYSGYSMVFNLISEL